MINGETIRRKLNELECPTVKGAKYLSDAVMICCQNGDAIFNLNVNVYPKIAARYGVNSKTVASDMRYAISKIGDEALKKHDIVKPEGGFTVKSFISALVAHLEYENG